LALSHLLINLLNGWRAFAADGGVDAAWLWAWIPGTDSLTEAERVAREFIETESPRYGVAVEVKPTAEEERQSWHAASAGFMAP
jgi:hypothetical protein